MCEGSLNGGPRFKVVGGSRCYYYDYRYNQHPSLMLLYIYYFMLLLESLLLLFISLLTIVYLSKAMEPISWFGARIGSNLCPLGTF